MTDRSPDTGEAAPSRPTLDTDDATPTNPTREPANPTRSRLRPRSPAGWATVILSATFVVLWAVFAVRAVDRNSGPTPTIAPPTVTATVDLRATVDEVNRVLFPNRVAGTPAATPAATPVATPMATPASPVTAPSPST